MRLERCMDKEICESKFVAQSTDISFGFASIFDRTMLPISSDYFGELRRNSRNDEARYCLRRTNESSMRKLD